MLHGNTAIPLTFVAFDLLRVDGHNLTCNPWSQRRTLLEGVWVDRQCARLADVFDDGHALFDAVVSYGLEGIVAKRRAGLYRSGYRGWTKVKNPATGAATGDRAHAAQPGARGTPAGRGRQPRGIDPGYGNGLRSRVSTFSACPSSSVTS